MDVFLIKQEEAVQVVKTIKCFADFFLKKLVFNLGLGGSQLKMNFQSFKVLSIDFIKINSFCFKYSDLLNNFL